MVAVVVEECGEEPITSPPVFASAHAMRAIEAIYAHARRRAGQLGGIRMPGIA
ncbi:MAG TPA: hypothetical protein VE777_08800 [Gaiellales bacterium]|nr:hypothetical protein [Gaiellales bacterium]